jgi:small subunit ribosomal protein S6
MKDMATKQNTYEAMFLFPAGAAVDTEAAINTARGIIERHGGQIIVIKKWDERRLAYEIAKQKRGLYIIAYYRGPGSSVSAIDRDVNLSEEILRVMITDASHLNEEEMAAVEPQPVEKERVREERGDRAPREERAPRARRDEAAPAAPAEAAAERE